MSDGVVTRVVLVALLLPLLHLQLQEVLQASHLLLQMLLIGTQLLDHAILHLPHFFLCLHFRLGNLQFSFVVLQRGRARG